MNSDLKSILKSIKLNESAISMVLGALVIIVVGVLVVNYFKGRDSGSILPALNTENTTAETPTVGKSYTVKVGDTLWSISEASYGDGYSWSEIAKENKLTDADAIQEGQVISIPEVATVTAEIETATTTTDPAEPTETIVATNSDEEPIAAATYTVVKGDNLWKVAVRAYGDGYKWSEVAKENKLLDPNIIHPGNVLILPR